MSNLPRSSPLVLNARAHDLRGVCHLATSEWYTVQIVDKLLLFYQTVLAPHDQTRNTVPRKNSCLTHLLSFLPRISSLVFALMPGRHKAPTGY